MNLPGLITVKPEQTDILGDLAYIMGESFMQELWTQEWLSALDNLGDDHTRKFEISRAIIKYNFIIGMPYECVYMLPDMSAVAGCYLASELGDKRWSDLEEQAMSLMCESTLTQAEKLVLTDKAEQMKVVSNFSWHYDYAQGKDFIHFFLLGVDSKKQGSGAFRRLITPFLDYADSKHIDCYLECYSDRLENLYAHFGFEVVQRISDPAFSIIERCMARRPQ